MTVNRIEKEGQHDRIPLFDLKRMRALVCFRMFSSGRQNGFVGLVVRFVEGWDAGSFIGRVQPASSLWRVFLACEFMRSKSLAPQQDFRWRACGYAADKLCRQAP